MKTVVIALGGNALIKEGQKGSFQEQLNNVNTASEHIASLVKKGYKIAITHGNGPQVGNILIQQEKAAKQIPKMPLFVCVAQSQGQIGYMLEKSLSNKLHRMGLNTPVVTVLTHILVDKKDPAFKKPSKRIGRVGYKGTRKVPSPDPLEIIETPVLQELIKSNIVISCGGGGIPVIKEHGLKGIEAVIDKDLASERLTEVINADIFVILTDIECVYLGYGSYKQVKLGRVGLKEIEKYYLEGEFPPGNMGPKILASIRFLEHNPKGKVVITSLSGIELALQGKRGTMITR